MKIKQKLIFTVFVTLSGLYANGQDTRFNQKNPDKPEVTEYMDPEIKIVIPGTVPSDATILFDGKNLDQWESSKDGTVAKWKVEDGVMTVVGGTGGISTKKHYGDCQLHIEWRSPDEPADKKGQGRGNSGVFFNGIYEVQVLNSFQNRTYRNGQAGSIYKQSPPLVNITSKQGDWNVYDIIYTAPKFTINGGIDTPAYITVIHNGVVVQNHTKIQGVTNYIGQPTNPVHGKGPIHLQDHGNAVSFKNVWIREL
jgi:Domain of Unknown Function (DUF1080)